MIEKTYSPDDNQLVAFRLGREEYGVNILQVQEIMRMTDIMRVPLSLDFIKGVMNIRGSVLPVMELKKRLGLPLTEYTEDTRIIIVGVNDTSVGIIVDAVSEVLTISNSDIEPPRSGNDVGVHFLSGIGKKEGRLVILLNLETIVSNEMEPSK